MKTVKSVVGKLVIGLVVLGVLVLNPWFGLTATRFDYGAAELRAAVEGRWQLTISAAHQPTRVVTFTVAQGREVEQSAARGLVRSAAACGTRSLVKSAEACMDVTRMPLELKLASGEVDGELRGELSVYGTAFRAAAITVMRGGARWLEAKISREGSASEVLVDGDATAKLVRLARAL